MQLSLLMTELLFSNSIGPLTGSFSSRTASSCCGMLCFAERSLFRPVAIPFFRTTSITTLSRQAQDCLKKGEAKTVPEDMDRRGDDIIRVISVG